MCGVWKTDLDSATSVCFLCILDFGSKYSVHVCACACVCSCVSVLYIYVVCMFVCGVCGACVYMFVCIYACNDG